MGRRGSRRLLAKEIAADLGVSTRTLTRHSAVLAAFRRPGGYRRNDLPAIRRRWSAARQPRRAKFMAFAEVAQLAGRSEGSLYQLTLRGVVQFVKLDGRLFLQRKGIATVIDFLRRRTKTPAGYFNAATLAAALGAKPDAVRRAVVDGFMVPDDRAASGAFLFREDRLDELALAWANRFDAPLLDAREMVVVTENGCIRPRRSPDPAVLAGALLLRLPLVGAPASPRPRRRYDLCEDLANGASRPTSRHLFQPQLKSMQSRRKSPVFRGSAAGTVRGI